MNLDRLLNRIIIIELFILVCLLAGCSSITFETPDGTVARWRTFEPFRERDAVIEYDPEEKIFRAGVNRTDTLTPEKIEAFGRGIGAGITKGIVPVP